MNYNEISQIMNQNLLAPLIFIFMCIFLFLFLVTVFYYTFLSHLIPKKLANLVLLLGTVYIFITSINHYEGIKSLVASWNVTTMLVVLISFFAFIGMVMTALTTKKKTKLNEIKQRPKNNNITKRIRSTQMRSDQEILNCTFEQMSGAEFERLLALYFRDQGYTVHEVGIGGKDGGVDLVIIDQRGEKTAVQAKCYADHNSVGVPVVRELVGAKRNHDCILSLLITTSDLTVQARKEAEQFKVDYWHGGLIKQKLKTWGKWNPTDITEIKSAQIKSAMTDEVACQCGAPMKQRKSGEGRLFWGCTTFPKCRHTKSIPN